MITSESRGHMTETNRRTVGHISLGWPWNYLGPSGFGDVIEHLSRVSTTVDCWEITGVNLTFVDGKLIFQVGQIYEIGNTCGNTSNNCTPIASQPFYNHIRLKFDLVASTTYRTINILVAWGGHNSNLAGILGLISRCTQLRITCSNKCFIKHL